MLRNRILLLFAMALPVFALDDRAIQVTSPTKVLSTRAALVHFIWGTSWAAVTAKQPSSVVHRYSAQPGDALPAQVKNLASMDRLDVSMGEIRSTAYVLYPANANRHKAVIVHHGHGCELVDGGDRPVHLEILIRRLVAAGYTVAAMRMPLYQDPAHCAPSRAHDKLFDRPIGAGSAVQFFLEPIARTVNYLLKEHADLREIDMIGLSGGGWTTTLYAAVDPRIIKSIPVAGTLPLYLRGENYNHDLEQYFTPLYQVAGYKDLYVLSAAGKGRLQLQILNRYDNCCFGERQHTVGPPSYIDALREYQLDVQKTLGALQMGRFAIHVDESAHYHQISVGAIEKAILLVLAGGPIEGL